MSERASTHPPRQRRSTRGTGTREKTSTRQRPSTRPAGPPASTRQKVSTRQRVSTRQKTPVPEREPEAKAAPKKTAPGGGTMIQFLLAMFLVVVLSAVAFGMLRGTQEAQYRSARRPITSRK